MSKHFGCFPFYDEFCQTSSHRTIILADILCTYIRRAVVAFCSCALETFYLKLKVFRRIEAMFDFPHRCDLQANLL